VQLIFGGAVEVFGGTGRSPLSEPYARSDATSYTPYFFLHS